MTNEGVATDAQLREAWEALSVEAVASADCPEPEEIIRAVERELTPARIREIVDHTSTCPACAEDWRLAHQLVREALNVPKRVPSSMTRLYLIAAAAVVVAVIAIWSPWEPSTGGGSIARGSRSGLESLVTDEALPRDAFLLRWTPGPEGSRYSVSVSTDELDLITTVEDLEEAQYLVPQAELDSLPGGAAILWQVVEERSDGSTTRSPTFVTRIR